MAAIDPAGVPPARPGLAFLTSHPAHCIALGFGSGLLRPAPGTWGTLAGWALFAAVDLLFRPGLPMLCALGVAGFATGIWAARRVGTALGEPDAGQIVIDEMVAIWWLLALIPQADRTGAVQAAAFVLFRLFDIFKPPPIRAIERRWHDATGVMLDDLMAAGYVLVLMALWTSVR
jgi:phosphatidylglycerophosphatase A